jgi:PAT family beta-lactamase induction signal transducer AmpG
MAGGLSGGLLVARFGLRGTYWPMIVVMHAPNVVFLALAAFQPKSLSLISAGLFVEQFGYGFGFTLYTLFLIYFSRGPLSTSHFAVSTGFMAMSLMLPGMLSGFVKTALGFQGFFVYALVATLPSFWVSWLAWRDSEFIAYFQPRTPEARMMEKLLDDSSAG